jgi:hypothetical protein
VVDGTQREKAEVEMGHGWRVGMGKKFTSTPLALCGEREKQKWKWVIHVILLPHCGGGERESRSGNGSRMMVGVEMGKKCYVRHVETKVKPDQLDASLTSLKGNESQA